MSRETTQKLHEIFWRSFIPLVGVPLPPFYKPFPVIWILKVVRAVYFLAKPRCTYPSMKSHRKYPYSSKKQMQKFHGLESAAVGPVRRTLKYLKGSSELAPDTGQDANCPGLHIVRSFSCSVRFVQFFPSKDPWRFQHLM